MKTPSIEVGYLIVPFLSVVAGCDLRSTEPVRLFIGPVGQENDCLCSLAIIHDKGSRVAN